MTKSAPTLVVATNNAKKLRELRRIAAHADHPWHEGLMADALVARAHTALRPVSEGRRDAG